MEEHQIQFKENNIMITINDLPLVLTATEVAQVLQVSRPQAYEIMRQADFPRINLTGVERGNVRVLRDELFNWLNKRQVKGA
jgi:predicted DNA-binding transcriptional regulator AlpA